ncbi:MAG TPA: hypothetical protein VFJ16_18940 [Longimicrobium sp.]|nr:hypothetical protein [Longimicrobium sp.]
MHPDKAVDIALQDLDISLALGIPAAPRRPWPARALLRVLRAWMRGWTWYASQGFAPAAVEPAFPLRARPRARARRVLPPGVARWITPSPALSVAQLYDCGTPAGCA